MQDERQEALEIALERLAEKMRKLDEEWQRRAIPGYQHHEIATNMLCNWFHQAEDMLRLLYGTEEIGEK